MSQFLDHVFIQVRSGDGGNGMVAWRREKYVPLGGPAGGHGGRGGHVFLEATNDLNTLIDFRFKHNFLASNGQKGGSKNKHGKNAEDLILRVPVGTLIRDAETGMPVADLTIAGQRVMVAEGGTGGKGNALLATQNRPAPHFCEPGQPGVERKLELELKVLADVGVIGLPNAGKSTLLSVVSAARPKIAAYPFSTLEPNLGVVMMPGGERGFVMADIPGLVEGASEGVGLGHDFLRHTERTRVLLHLLDMSSETIEQDFATIDNELSLYSEELSKLPRLIVLTKADVVDEETIAKIEKSVKKKTSKRSDSPPVVISAATGRGVPELINQTMALLVKTTPEEDIPPPQELPADERASDHSVEEFAVHRKKKVFVVTGDRVLRLVAVTNMRDTDALRHLHYVLRSMGVIDALIAEGATPGSDVHIGEMAFTFGDEWS